MRDSLGALRGQVRIVEHRDAAASGAGAREATRGVAHRIERRCVFDTEPCRDCTPFTIEFARLHIQTDVRPVVAGLPLLRHLLRLRSRPHREPRPMLALYYAPVYFQHDYRPFCTHYEWSHYDVDGTGGVVEGFVGWHARNGAINQ